MILNHTNEIKIIFNLLKLLLKQIFLFLYIVYKQYEFIHNDSHY
jgi:hypothetical protein